ncbi:cation:proton antiporter [Frondihabitans peucedani]|uniref:cation:proton antiporter n=1 Tax=Frondihabitans peucedani TaxID=598626 RepID=UPI0031D8793E
MILITVCFVVVTVSIAGLSSRFGFFGPMALVAVGAGISFIPAVPQIKIEPDVILFGILPPLLYAAAIRTSFIDTRARRDPIIILSVGLVAYTVFVVGIVAWLIVPALSLAAALAFGAVIAPTDAVAVNAVTRKAPLPRIVTTVLDGESLLNDATALAALNAAIAAITTVVTPLSVAGNFAITVCGGLGVGLAVGVILGWLRRRIHEAVVDTSLSLVAPFVAFLPAQLIGASGILAVVISGLYLSYRSPVIQSAEARIAESLNWRTVQFVLENAVFLLIGLSLAGIVENALKSDIPVWQMALISIVVLAVMLVSRLLWGFGLTAVFRFGPRQLRRQSWHWHQPIAVSFAGVRGVVTLAAVFLLPEATPQRAFLQLLAFVVVVGTLLQSLALPLIVRVLPTLVPPNFEQERMETRLLLSEAQQSGLDSLEDHPETFDPRVLARLRADATFLSDSLKSGSGTEPPHESYARARQHTLQAERAAVLRARAEHRYQEPAVRAVLRILDAEEVALATSAEAKAD